jgi:hypothetical protein
MSANRIFISYRREDGSGQAGRLSDRLVRRFGDARVFMDVDDIAAGADFARVLEARLAECSVLLAVIGPRWLALRDAQGQRRIDDAQDYVRIEIATALALGKRVIPVLVGGAVLPAQTELPEPLRPLARCQAVALRDDRFLADAQSLIESIEPGPRLDRRWIAVGAAAAIALIGTLQLGRTLAPAPAPAPGAQLAGALAGRWQARVTYGWGATHDEAFEFRVEDGELAGSAGFLGRPRPIVEGRADAQGIRFVTRTESVEGGGTMTLTHRYSGRLEEGRLRLRLLTEGGASPRDPVEFVAERPAPSP